MQMGPYARRAHPDQILRALGPVVEQAAREMQDGAPAASILREAVLAGFLVGSGMPLGSAAELVRQWRSTGMSTELQRPATASPAQSPSKAQPPSPGLLKQIEDFMQDEASATAFYRQMAEQAEKQNAGPVAVDYIRHAMEDEAKHYTILQQLYRELTGRTYELAPQKITFESLSEGLLAAMNDEYEAMEEYRTIYLVSKNDRIRDVFFELMTDELEHATRFNYVLQILQTNQA